jgi:hypothetical protein
VEIEKKDVFENVLHRDKNFDDWNLIKTAQGSPEARLTKEANLEENLPYMTVLYHKTSLVLTGRGPNAAICCRDASSSDPVCEAIIRHKPKAVSALVDFYDFAEDRSSYEKCLGMFSERKLYELRKRRLEELQKLALTEKTVSGSSRNNREQEPER